MRFCLIKFFTFAISSLAVHNALCQHTVDFQIPTHVCTGQYLDIKNTSDVGDSVSWSFCQPLEGTYTSTSQGTLGSNPAGLSIVEDNGDWFGFYVRRSDELVRIDFGSSPENASYTTTSLGNPGGMLNGSDWIKMIKSNGTWYALVTNLAGEPLLRLKWGTSLTSVPTVQSLNLSSTGKFNSPAQIDIKKDGDNYVAVIANSASNKLSLVNFGSSMENMPTGADVIESPVLSGSVNMYGVTVNRICDQWTIYTTVTNELYKINMGATLFHTIDPTQIIDFSSDVPMSIGSYNRMTSIVVGTDTYVYFCSYTMHYVSGVIWHQGASNAEFKDLRSLTVPDQLYSLESFKYNNRYGLYLSSFITGASQLITVTPGCYVTQETSTAFTPKGNSYTTSGSYSISLNIFYSDGTTCSATKQIIVDSNMSPDIDFTAQNNCVQNDVVFTASNSSGGIVSYVWDYGDASATGSGVTSIHQFSSIGNYTANLIVTGSNGCVNSTQKAVKIFSKPVADFALPTSSVVCTNQAYTFSNTSLFDGASNPQWQWYINGTAVSTASDLIETFATISTASIQLAASIPGCSSQQTKNFTIQQQGPIPDFSYTGVCQNSGTQFTNLTTGSGLSYSWNFGDTNMSAAVNPQNIYTTTGMYSVTLIASNALGCNNSTTKTLTIYTAPQTDLSIALPPFSCSGSASQFSDNTPLPTDSNLISWQWNFGDPSSSQNTSTSKNPSHLFATAGQYAISLTATTDVNCSATILKTVNIAQSPVASFSNTPACKDLTTTFADTSTGNPKSWNWQIGTASSILQKPTYVFNVSGNYNVALSINAANGCIASVSKTIFIPAAQFPDFVFHKACVGQETIFKDSTASSSDPIKSYDWDFASAGSATGSPSTVTFSTKGNYGVKLKVTAQSGCSYTVAKNVNVLDAPVASFVATPMLGVPPLNVQFTNTSTLATSYVWTFNDTKTVTSTNTSASHTFNEFGDYVVDLTAFNSQGCSNTVSKIISVVLPTNDIAIIALSTIQNRDGSLTAIATLKNNSNTSLSDITVVMDLSGNATLRDSLAVTLLPDQVYNYPFNYQITNPSQLAYICADVVVENDVNKENDRSCISLNNKAFVYNAYPNPANDQLHVDFIATANEIVSIRMVDALSKESFSDEVAIDTGLNQYVIPASNLSPGIYILTIQSTSERKTFKISISR